MPPVRLLVSFPCVAAVKPHGDSCHASPPERMRGPKERAVDGDGDGDEDDEDKDGGHGGKMRRDENGSDRYDGGLGPLPLETVLSSLYVPRPPRRRTLVRR